jgi:uncharacterized membrane protein
MVMLLSFNLCLASEMKVMEQKNTNIPTAMMSKSASWRGARLAIFTALSAVGSLIKIPSPIGSVAFDSSPGFFVALFFGPLEGAAVCGIGHLATAAVSGFPLGVLHIPIAFGMALAGAAVGLINKLNRQWGFIPAIIAGVAINTLMVFPMAPLLDADASVGWFIAIGFAPFLLVGAVLNVAVAASAYVGVRGKLRV